MKSLAVEMLRAQLDTVVGRLLYLTMPEQGGWRGSQGPFQPERFCDSVKQSSSISVHLVEIEPCLSGVFLVSR